MELEAGFDRKDEEVVVVAFVVVELLDVFGVALDEVTDLEGLVTVDKETDFGVVEVIAGLLDEEIGRELELEKARAAEDDDVVEVGGAELLLLCQPSQGSKRWDLA